MTPRELKIALAFEDVSFPPATSQKRFAKQMIHQAKNSPEKPLSEKQAKYLVSLAYRFRRQIPANLAYPDEEPPCAAIDRFLSAPKPREPGKAKTPELGKAKTPESALQSDLFAPSLARRAG